MVLTVLLQVSKLATGTWSRKFLTPELLVRL